MKRVLSALKTLGRSLKRHPWWAALGLGTAVACGQFLCPYFGWTVAGTLVLLGITQTPEKEDSGQ